MSTTDNNNPTTPLAVTVDISTAGNFQRALKWIRTTTDAYVDYDADAKVWHARPAEYVNGTLALAGWRSFLSSMEMVGATVRVEEVTTEDDQ